MQPSFSSAINLQPRRFNQIPAASRGISEVTLLVPGFIGVLCVFYKHSGFYFLFVPETSAGYLQIRNIFTVVVYCFGFVNILTLDLL